MHPTENQGDHRLGVAADPGAIIRIVIATKRTETAVSRPILHHSEIEDGTRRRVQMGRMSTEQKRASLGI